MDKRQKQNLIFTLAGLIGVVLILVTGYFTFKNTQGMKTYKSDTYKFSIQYPEDWAVTEDKNGAAVLIYSPQETDLDFFQENINIVVQSLSKPISLLEYTNLAIMQMKAVFRSNIEIVESSDTQVSGSPGHKFVFIGKGPDARLQYQSRWTIINRVAYQVTYTSAASQYDKYLPVVEKMMDSFKVF